MFEFGSGLSSLCCYWQKVWQYDESRAVAIGEGRPSLRTSLAFLLTWFSDRDTSHNRISG